MNQRRWTLVLCTAIALAASANGVTVGDGSDDSMNSCYTTNEARLNASAGDIGCVKSARCSVCVVGGPQCESTMVCDVKNPHCDGNVTSSSNSGSCGGSDVDGHAVVTIPLNENVWIKELLMTQVFSTDYLVIDGGETEEGGHAASLSMSESVLKALSDIHGLKLRNVTLDDDIKLPSLSHLEILELNGDGLMFLDGLVSSETFQNATRPLTLSLRHNRLTSIPTTIFEIPHLDVLQLQDNLIKQQRLTTAQFQFLSNLTRLELDPDTFQNSNCDHLVVFASNPDYSICDPSSWIPNSSGNSESTDASSGNSDEKISTDSMILYVLVPISLVALGVLACCMYQKKSNKKQLLTGQQHSATVVAIYRDNNGEDNIGTGDGGFYQVFNHKDDGELLLMDLHLETWRCDASLISMEKPLGNEGKGSLIWKASYQGEPVVVKKLPVGTDPTTEAFSDLVEEVRMVAMFSHPNVIRFCGVAWTKEIGLHVLMEYMDRGDLHTYLQINRGMYASSAWWGTRKLEIALDVAEGLLYLHSLQRVAHCALTSLNILLDHEFKAKIREFRCAQYLSDYEAGETIISKLMSSRLEKKLRLWLAPEVLCGSSTSISEAIDIYAFGILLAELDLSDSPLERTAKVVGCTEAQLLHRVMESKEGVAIAPTISNTCPPELRALLLACVATAPSDRPNATILVHTLRDLLEKVQTESSLEVFLTVHSGSMEPKYQDSSDGEAKPNRVIDT